MMRMNGFRRKLTRTAGAMTILATCLWFLPVTAAAQNQARNTDSDLQAAVATAISHDALLKNQPITVEIANGVVTLGGTTETEQQRQQAETDAANVQGVSGIQNNITVTGTQSSQAAPPDQTTPPPPPPDTQQPQAPPTSEQNPPPPPPDQPGQPAQPGQPGQPPARTPYPQGGYYGQQQPYPSRPYYQQPSGPVTVPAGTLLQIRLSEPLDTAKLQDGAVFQATAASDVYEGNVLAIPRGAVLQGVVVKVKKAGALGGNAELQLDITGLTLGGQTYPVSTDLWSSRGPNKAGYTAGNTAGGAVLGAIIGGIIGRGPGAAVGALAGGGAGLAASGATNGPRIYLPAEARLNFHLSNPITVQPVSWQEAQRLARNVPHLVRRPIYMAPPYPYGYPYPYAYPYPYPYPY